MDRDGHIAFPGLLTDSTREELTAALMRIFAMPVEDEDYPPRRFAAEFDSCLEGLVGHPELVGLARTVLGEEIRFDHAVALNRPGGSGPTAWHSHEYGEANPGLGFIRIFFYVNGFEAGDGGLKVVPGSHHYRDPALSAPTDAELEAGWLVGKVQPETGEPLRTEALSVPPGTVILMWTHAAHGVTPRSPDSDTRWCIVYAYRNPGEPSAARWISEEFERRQVPGNEGLMSLY